MAVAERADILVGSILTTIKLRDMWMNSGAPALPNNLAEAIDDLIAVWEEGDLPADCRLLYEEYLALKKAWIRFGEYMSETIRAPKQEFWAALKEMEGKLINREDAFHPPILETVTDLRSMKPEVGWVQICYIYCHKGVGPFMDKHKRPIPSLAMQQHKFENLCETCRNFPEDPKRFCGKCRGARNVLKEWFDKAGISPFDEFGNLISLSSVERMKAGSRVEKRLQDRAIRLLGGVMPDGGDGNGVVMEDELPLTREQMDAAEGTSSVAPPIGGDIGEEPISPDDQMGAMVAASEDAALAEQVYDLIDKNPNIENRSLADTFGVSVNKIKQMRQARQKAKASS